MMITFTFAALQMLVTTRDWRDKRLDVSLPLIVMRAERWRFCDGSADFPLKMRVIFILTNWCCLFELCCARPKHGRAGNTTLSLSFLLFLLRCDDE